MQALVFCGVPAVLGRLLQQLQIAGRQDFAGLIVQCCGLMRFEDAELEQGLDLGNGLGETLHHCNNGIVIHVEPRHRIPAERGQDALLRVQRVVCNRTGRGHATDELL